MSENTVFAALSDIDRIVHEPARLLIMAHLSVLESADFLFLLRQTGLTRGNLSTHARKLEDAGYVEMEKSFIDRLPLTVYRLTESGRKAIQKYRRDMTEVFESIGS